jgi:uncharacterized protein YndB with AHSA1/START domain
MTERRVTHSTFVLERTYDASPERVFAAWADAEAKAKWFSGPPEWGPSEHQLDFRVGGKEISRGGPKGGPVSLFEARYEDIVPNERIVTNYTMYLDDNRISVSVWTIELRPEGQGTRLVLTDQGAYLDGFDDVASREHGTAAMLDQLGASLEAEPAKA